MRRWRTWYQSHCSIPRPINEQAEFFSFRFRPELWLGRCVKREDVLDLADAFAGNLTLVASRAAAIRGLGPVSAASGAAQRSPVRPPHLDGQLDSQKPHSMQRLTSGLAAGDGFRFLTWHGRERMLQPR